VVRHDFPTSVLADAGVTMRLARGTDAELLSEWTHAPEVNQYWGGRPITVQEALAKYTGRRAPEVVSYVICEQARSVGYLQAWQQQGRYGLDMFISREAQGRGIGPRAARALATELTALGWRPLTADPALDNPRAIGAWRAAGFEDTGELGVDDGKTTQIMSFSAPQSAQPPLSALADSHAADPSCR
jgi:aminoglycoside 6'-N-acetyltransferase